jgi:hypothetical protein
MKKTDKKNPLKFFNDNKAMAYKKAGGEMAAYKKSLLKANNGTIVKNMAGPGDPPGTPFQSYMKTTGATAADTSANTPYKANLLTKNNPLLNEAYSLTYGNDYGSSNVANPHGSFESRRGDNSGYTNVNQPQRSAYEKAIATMTPKKKGGTHKMPNGKVMLNSKMKKGGVMKSKKK